MSADTAEFAWENAEQRTFNWLIKKTGSTKDVDAFIASYPKAINFTERGVNWTWEVNGGGETIQISGTNRPRVSWKMSGKLRGIFTERRFGQEFVGRLLDVVPYDLAEQDPNMYGIQTLRPITEPMMEQGTMQIADDIGNIGGEIPVWLLDWDFIVAFFNTERAV